MLLHGSHSDRLIRPGELVGTVQTGFIPINLIVGMMMTSVVAGLIVTRPWLGWPRAAWLRSANPFKLMVAMLMYFLAAFLLPCSVVFLLFAALMNIAAVEAWAMSLPWQARLAMYGVALFALWILLFVALVRAARRPEADSASRPEPYARPLSDREREASARKKLETEAAAAATRSRISGVFMLILGLIAAYVFVYKPYAALLVGATAVTFNPVAVVVLPLVLGHGLAYGVIGDSARELLGEAESRNKRGWLLAALGLAVGALLYWGLTKQLPTSL